MEIDETEVLVEIFRKARSHVEIYYTYMEKWLDGRQRLIKSVKEIADDIDKHTFNSNIARTSGASVSAVGVGLTLGGLLFPPLAIIGIGVGVVGGVTSAGASIAQGAIETSKRGDVKKLIEEDQAIYQKIKEALDAIDEAAGEARHALGDAESDLTKEQIKGILLIGKVAVSTGVQVRGFVQNLVKVIVSRSLSAAAPESASAALAAGQTMTAVGRIVSKGLLVVSIPLTIIDLASSIRGLVDRSAKTKDLRELTERLEEEYNEMKDRYTSFKKMASEIVLRDVIVFSSTGVRYFK